MDTNYYKYLNFLAYCLNEQAEVPNVKGLDWGELYKFSQQQAIVAIMLSGIDKLTKSNKLTLDIPKALLFEWIGQANMIETQNKLLNQRIKELTRFLKEQGKNSCILKGQGNALMYPNPTMRTCGDVDVWIEGTKKGVVDFVHQRFPDMNVQYHHMSYPIFNDVEVELHYYPSYCYNKWHNYRLQQFFRESSEAQFVNINKEGYATPTMSFNLVFQLSHMMRHFFTQGIGLRHAIDYYYLLQQDISDTDKHRAIGVMKRCGMYKFFCAMMWIETQILGLKKNTDMAPLRERTGTLLLKEMLKGGNFGHQYEHNHKGIIAAFASQMAYNMQYLWEFPSEPLSRPFALIWDFLRKHS